MLGQRAQGRAGKVALTVDANDARRCTPSSHALRPDMLQLHGTETAGAGGGGALAFRPAGDEGACRSPTRADLSPIRPLCQCRRLSDCSMPGRRAERHAPGRARQDLRLDAAGQPRSRTCRIMLSGGLDAGECRPRRCASPGRPGVDVSSGRRALRPAKRTPTRFAPLSARPVPPMHRSSAAERLQPHDRSAAAQFFPHRARTSAATSASMAAASSPRRLMPLILDLEKAYADAKADPAFQSEMDGHLAHYVGRPSPLVFRRAPDREIRRRQDLLQARRSSTTPARTR